MPLKMMRPRLDTLETRTVKPAPKTTAAHYGTPQHDAWRAAIIARDGYRCRVCGRRDGRLYADHIVELQDGGAPLDPANGQMLCASHHSLKTAHERAKRIVG